MKKLILITFLITVISTLNAQSPFRVKVIDAQSSENISNAIVFIEEIPLPDQETDRYGLVVFQNVPEDRKVRINVRKKGYLPSQIEVVANRAIKVDNNIIIKLSKEPSTPQVIIYGEVTDENDNEIEGATVEVSILGKPYTSKTDKSGNYQIRVDGDMFKALPSFQIEAKKSNCKRSKSTETVPNSPIINKDISLKCSSSKDRQNVSNFNEDNKQVDKFYPVVKEFNKGKIKIKEIRKIPKGIEVYVQFFNSDNVTRSISLPVGELSGWKGSTVLHINGEKYLANSAKFGNSFCNRESKTGCIVGEDVINESWMNAKITFNDIPDIDIVPIFYVSFYSGFGGYMNMDARDLPVKK